MFTSDTIARKSKIFGDSFAGIMGKVAPVLFETCGIVWVCLKIIMMTYINVKGFKLVEVIIECLKKSHMKKRNNMVILVILLWVQTDFVSISDFRI